MTNSNTKTQILNVAQALVQSRGLNAMSYKDLSEAVGIRKASVHHHYPTKQDLVYAMLDRYIDAFEQAVANAIANGKTGREQLKAYFELYLTPLLDAESNKLCLCGILSSELDSLDERNAALVQHFFDLQHQHLVSILNKGSEDMSLKVNADVTAQADALLGSLEGALLVSRMSGGVARMRKILKELLNLL